MTPGGIMMIPYYATQNIRKKVKRVKAVVGLIQGPTPSTNPSLEGKLFGSEQGGASEWRGRRDVTGLYIPLGFQMWS